MTLFKILNRWSDKVIFEKETDSLRLCVEAAVESRVSLSGAVLRDAVLSGAVLSDDQLKGVPKIRNIHQRVYEAASPAGALNMSAWHSCDTTHCRAGWVTHLCGDAGAALEWAMGTPGAAAMIYLASDPNLERIPNFYAGNDAALADMMRLADQEAAAQRAV